MHNSSCRNIITKPPTQDVEFCNGCDFFCLFALFPEEDTKIARTWIVTSRHSAEQHAKAPPHWIFKQILSLGLTICQFLFSCGHLILHQNHCWPFLVFMMSVWIFITVWAAETKQRASVACVYSCKVWIWESQSSDQACHFSFWDAWLMEIGDSALLPSSAFQRKCTCIDEHQL